MPLKTSTDVCIQDNRGHILFKSTSENKTENTFVGKYVEHEIDRNVCVQENPWKENTKEEKK